MKNYSREIVSAIICGHGLKEVLRGLLENEINHLLTHELSAYLGYIRDSILVIIIECFILNMAAELNRSVGLEW